MSGSDYQCEEVAGSRYFTGHGGSISVNEVQTGVCFHSILCGSCELTWQSYAQCPVAILYPALYKAKNFEVRSWNPKNMKSIKLHDEMKHYLMRWSEKTGSLILTVVWNWVYWCDCQLVQVGGSDYRCVNWLTTNIIQVWGCMKFRCVGGCMNMNICTYSWVARRISMQVGMHMHKS